MTPEPKRQSPAYPTPPARMGLRLPVREQHADAPRGRSLTQSGHDVVPVTERDILGPSEGARQGTDYYSHTRNPSLLMEKLARCEPATLACMHGSPWRGDGWEAAPRAREVARGLNATRATTARPRGAWCSRAWYTERRCRPGLSRPSPCTSSAPRSRRRSRAARSPRRCAGDSASLRSSSRTPTRASRSPSCAGCGTSWRRCSARTTSGSRWRVAPRRWARCTSSGTWRARQRRSATV